MRKTLSDQNIHAKYRLEAARMLMLAEGFDLRKLRMARESNMDPEEDSGDVSDIQALIQRQEGVQ